MAAVDFIVDVHHHYMPPEVFDRLAAQAGGPRIVTREISLTLSPSRKNLDAHLAVMDEAGVGVSILTDQVQVLGPDVARALNDGIAEVERKYPGRFRGAIHLPVHEPEAARRELERGIGELGLRAVALLACHLDIQLDNPVMDPLYEIIQRNGLPIVIHPQSRPTGSETTYNLDRCVFRPLETTQAIVRVLASVLPRFPELKFVMPHLGGAASSLKGRMMAFFEPPDAPVPAGLKGYLKTRSEQNRLGLAERFEALFRRLYFDTAGTGAWHPALAAAFNMTTADRIMFGSDYPLECKSAANLTESLDMIRQAPCSSEERSAMLGKTAAELFGL
ncbi:MAG TPA: amidohydrolase family protein [candidate division Zixibacteria bacterium]|nr:amidohydrolase family protein [candidate division Zixibacteria bacterium]